MNEITQHDQAYCVNKLIFYTNVEARQQRRGDAGIQPMRGERRKPDGATRKQTA